MGSKRRRDIAIEATYQIASLFDAIAEQGRLLDVSVTPEASTVIKALALRGRVLTDAAMSALADTAVATKDLERLLSHG